MKKIDAEGAAKDLIDGIGEDGWSMPDTKKVGYVVFHSGNAKGTIPFYLTQSRTVFSKDLDVAEVFHTPEEARDALAKLLGKIGEDAACRKYIGIGRIHLDVIARVSDSVRQEVKDVIHCDNLAERLGNEDGVVEILHLDGFPGHYSDVFAVPKDKTVRIRCGVGSHAFYEVDCECGNYVEWIEHMEEKSWYSGEFRRVGNEYIRHFCEKWGR